MTEQATQIQAILGIVLAMAGTIVAALIAIAVGITVFVTNTWKGRIDVLEELVTSLRTTLDENTTYWKEKVEELEGTITKMGLTIRGLQENQKPPPVPLTPAVEAAVAAVTDTPAPTPDVASATEAAAPIPKAEG